MLTDPKSLRKTLRGLADLLADEAGRNPDFAEALAGLFGPSPSPGRARRRMDKDEPAPDPFEAFRAMGSEGFRAWLCGLSVQELRSIIRQHRFDPSRLSDKWKTKGRFVEIICDRMEARTKQGDVFRHYGRKTEDSDPSKGHPEAS